MFTLSYAIRAIARNRGRYLLFALVLVTLSAVCFTNLSLGSTADSICEAIKMEYGAKMRLAQTNPSTYAMKLSEYDVFAQTELVEECEVRSVIRNDGGNAVSIETQKIIPGTSFWRVGFNPDYPNPFNRRYNPAVLLEGRLCEAENECVISDLFFNRLRAAGAIRQVGDSITCVASSTFRKVDGKIVEDAAGNPLWDYTYIDYIVVGIVDSSTLDKRYRDQEEINKTVVFFPFETVSAKFEAAERNMLLYDTIYFDPQNEICVGYDVVYRLRSYADSDAFRAYVDEVMLGKYTGNTEQMISGNYRESMKLIQDANRGLVAESVMPEFEQLLAPLEQLQTFTTLTTVTVAVLALASVFLMCIINMRERKYEIGVLRCVGMSRPRINLSLGFESAVFLLCAALVGIALGLGVSALSGGLFLDLTVVETAIDTAAISRRVAAALVASALVLSLFATTVSAAFVMRARPLAILRNRT